jgi:hypothetical protein
MEAFRSTPEGCARASTIRDSPFLASTRTPEEKQI